MDWLLELPGVDGKVRSVIAVYIDAGLALKKCILKVTRQITELSRTARYRGNCDLLMGIPGIGRITAMNLLTQLRDITRFKTIDELCHYVGIVPNMNSSGEKSATGRMTRRGRKKIKIQLIEAAWTAVRKDPALMARFNSVRLPGRR